MADDYKNWLKRAKSNYEIAKTAKGEDICYEDLCYEAQQCSEKALKRQNLVIGEFSSGILLQRKKL